jgi:S1-C subfamily serine protease
MSEPAVVTPEPLAPTVEPRAPVPGLRREAVLPSERRGGLGAVALLCSLAGVASGFALATTILATQIAQSEARVHRVQSGLIRPQPYLGVEYQPDSSKAILLRVVPRTPAAEVGLAPGDHIVRFNGELLDRPRELGQRIAQSQIGAEVTLEVTRGGTTMILHPTLGRLYAP